MWIFHFIINQNTNFDKENFRFHSLSNRLQKQILKTLDFTLEILHNKNYQRSTH